jgi:hypothetical protein
MNTPARLRPAARSRIVHLDGGQARGSARNVGTEWALGPPVASSHSYRKLFVRHYRLLRELVCGIDDPGVAVFALDRGTGAVAGRLWVAGRTGEASGAVVGRHGNADLYLADDPTLSLRHLAVVVEPLRGWSADAVRYRVLDLRSGIAFRDERARALEAVVADGPVFLEAGAYLLLMFPTGEERWPLDAEASFDLLPERIFLDDRAAEPDRWARAEAPAARRAARRSYVTLMPGPMPVGASLLDPSERSLGALSIESSGGRSALKIGPSAADRGVLLGRLPRCDASGLLAHPALSRVHLMLVSVRDELYALDTGSTDGTWRQDDEGAWQRVRMVRLSTGDRLVLGRQRAEVTWTPS